MLNDNSVIQLALDSIENHPNHHLEIGIRRQVWLLFGDGVYGIGIKDMDRKKRFLLSLMCAERVKDIYDEYFYSESDILSLYSESITISHAYWNEEICFDEFNKIAENFYCEFIESGRVTKAKEQSTEGKLKHRKAWNAMASMWECLRVSLYDHPFTYEHQIESHIKDSDIDIVDYYDHDAAYCAAKAFAGSEWDLENSDREKRLKFWRWWLEEAVPKVLNMSNNFN